MGCCGGGRGKTPSQLGVTRQAAPASPLAAISADQKVWVQYNGSRNAAFGVKGRFTGTVYRIDGPGHKLEVHVNDLNRFKRSGRGSDFAIGVTTPDNGTATEATIPTPTIQDTVFQAPSPEIAQIERLDKRAASRG